MARRCRILIIDDQPDHVATLAVLLRGDGHEVEYATNPLYAIGLAQEFHPEFVFLDIGLPYMSGYDVMARLRQQFKAARIIAITGRGGEDERAKALHAGFDEYLVKPVEIDVIERLLEAYTERDRTDAGR